MELEKFPKKYIDKTISVQQCGELVRNKVHGANGAAWNTNSNKCYAGYGATGIDLVWSFQACIFEGKLMLHCIVLRSLTFFTLNYI